MKIYDNNALQIADIDECSQMISGCEQDCEDTSPGFQCKCRVGFNRDTINYKKCIAGELGISTHKMVQQCICSIIIIK